MNILSKEEGSLEAVNPEAKIFKHNLLFALLSSHFHSSSDSRLISLWAQRHKASP